MPESGGDAVKRLAAAHWRSRSPRQVLWILVKGLGCEHGVLSTTLGKGVWCEVRERT